MDGQDFIYGFELYNDYFLHEHVDAVAAIDLFSFVQNGKLDLTPEWNSPLGEFVREASLVGTFQQARTEYAMDFNGRADDFVGDAVAIEKRVTLFPFLRSRFLKHFTTLEITPLRVLCALRGENAFQEITKTPERNVIRLEMV
ncbi:MAG: hypothetical protein U0573_15505 [Phycisphaerales bacterium]